MADNRYVCAQRYERISCVAMNHVPSTLSLGPTVAMAKGVMLYISSIRSGVTLLVVTHIHATVLVLLLFEAMAS